MEKTKQVNPHKETIEKLCLGLLIAIVFINAFNFYEISKLKDNGGSNKITGNIVANTNNLVIDIIPKGIPRIYGKELDVSYDYISSSNPELADLTIRKLGTLDQRLEVGGKDLERYISIVSRISCEYCCGADSIIFADGRAACGCAHSFAMRGLAKYLIKYHPNEFTDDQILEELGKWKTLFFPDAISKKAVILQSRGIELNYVNLASNKYRDIEKEVPAGSSASGGMVGGC